MLNQYFKKFKNLKIGTKILIIVLLISFIAQISTGILAFISITQLSNYSQNEASNLGEETALNGETALKNQAESYLKEVSSSMAEASDNILEEVSDEVAGLSVGIEDIYTNSGNFAGHSLPLPETTVSGDSSDRTDSTEKAYAVDPANSSSDKTTVLAYDVGSYAAKYENKVYRTTLRKWLELTDEERTNIHANKIVVSENSVPSEIQNEIKIISNVSYLSKPIYESNAAVSSVYIGTESGIFYRYSPSNSSERFDPRTRSWYTDAIIAKEAGNNTPLWQSTYIGKSDGKLCITCSKAFTDKNGKILGVAAIDLYLENINQYVIGTTIGNTGYAFVTDNNGKIIMHPDYKLDESGNVIGNFNTEPLKSDDTSGSYKELLSAMDSNKTGVKTAKINGKDYYVAYSPLTTPGWSLGAASEIEEIIAPAVEIRKLISSSADTTKSAINSALLKVLVVFIIIFAICSILICILSFRLSKEILAPIKRLQSQAKIIGEGEFSARIRIESNDELGDLSRSFNKMAENLKIYMDNLEKTTIEKEKIHSELMIAKKIQSSMLPCIFPAFPDRKDFDVYAMMDPAKEIGGDFYDFFFVDKNNFALVIADVSGKGVSAALFMVIAKILLKNQLQNGDSPAKVLEVVNDRLCENNEASMFVTAFIGLVNIKEGTFTYANAGHNPPLIYEKSKDEYKFIGESHGFVLGGMPKMKYTEETTSLQKDDLIFMYTDGVTEATDTNGKLFSKEKLKQILSNPQTKKMSIKDIIIALRSDIDKFANESERTDDITMLAFKDFDIPDSDI